jgi:hypothetical protein
MPLQGRHCHCQSLSLSLGRKSLWMRYLLPQDQGNSNHNPDVVLRPPYPLSIQYLLRIMIYDCLQFHKVVFLSLFLVSFLIHSSRAAHPRQKVVVTRPDTTPSYGREVTTFNPQGRLEQVEYGMMASERGGCIGVLKCNITLYLLVEHPSSTIGWGTSNDKVQRIDDNKFLLTTGLVGDGR